MNIHPKVAKARRKVLGTVCRKTEEEIIYMDLMRARDEDYAQQKAKLHTREDLASWMIAWDADNELWLAEEDYLRTRTTLWRQRAIASLVELPPENDIEGYWEQRDGTPWFLTDKGVAYVRAAVRQESLASREMLFRVATLMLAGLAVTISLIALFK